MTEKKRFSFAFFKRDLKLFISEAASALCSAAILIAICIAAATAAAYSAATNTSQINIALSDNEDTVLSRILIGMISDSDIVSALLNIENVDENTAVNGVKSGKYYAALILPNGLIGSIMDGSNCHASLILPHISEIESSVVFAIAKTGEKYMSAAQFGVYTGQYYLRNSVPDGAALMQQYLLDSNTVFINSALSACNNAEEQHFLSYQSVAYSGTSLSLGAHFVAVFAALFLILCTLFFPKLMFYDINSGVYLRCRAAGAKAENFLIGKLFFPFIFRLLPTIIVTAVLGFAFGYITVSVRSIVYLLAALLYTSITGGCICLLFHNKRSAVSIISLASALSMFLVGAFLPPAMLPKNLLELGYLTPLGTAYKLIAPLLGGRIQPFYLFFAFILSIFFITITALSLKSSNI